ncbi:hypothetical protein MVEN_02515000 [Mycena venus]|uniref:Uncharacterized protein n=1 Tax=Mycena venus TaxID=2733690 RepID=A0A8H7C936_9AGAR|nr:hypothetical protein MVEN_02515000 [Mycena venus]
MEPVVSLNPDTTLGAYQIGVLVSYVLFGVTTIQMYIYYTRFPEDSIKLKVLVAFVWACELAHTLCVGYGLYVWTISEYGHPELIFGHSNTSLAVAVVFSGLIGASVQGFFSFRIYSLSRKMYIPLFIWIMSFWRLLSGILVLTGTLQSSNVEGAEGQWGWALLASWSVSAANDLAITVALVTILIRQRMKGLKAIAGAWQNSSGLWPLNKLAWDLSSQPVLFLCSCLVQAFELNVLGF